MLTHSKTATNYTSVTNKEETVYTLCKSTLGGTAHRKHRYLTRRKLGTAVSTPMSGAVISTASDGLLAGCILYIYVFSS